MNNWLRLSLSLLGWACLVGLARGELATWRATGSLPAGITKAEVHVERDLPPTHGVVVLIPGMNGDGRVLAQEAAWKTFAKEHGLGLAGVSFVSPVGQLYGNPAKGYYYPEQGAGDLLLQGLRILYGHEVKVLLYGFSGGAQFTSRFVELHPECVQSWAAYSASFWSAPANASQTTPPGIVACGEYDSARYGPSFAYFQEGRRKEARWTWVSLGRTGHLRHRQLEEFIRAYFAAILAGHFEQASWLDAETRQPVSEDDRLLNPALSVWLPTPEIAADWLKLHQP